MRAPHDEIEALAASQCGVVGRHQLVGAGATAAEIDSRLRTRRWREVAPGVYSYPGHRQTWLRSLWIAFLHAGPDAVVSHQSAGRILRIEGIGTRISLIVPRDRRHVPRGAHWHRLDDLSPTDVVEWRGFRVTSPARTAVDLAGVLGRAALATAVEDGIVRGLFSVAEVGAVLARVRRRGKPGVRRLCDVLDLLGPGEGPARSELEKMLDRVVELSGLPRPLREHPLPSVQGLVGFVDRYFPEAHLIVEADGRKWHERRRNMARDAERDIEAARCGEQTTRMMWEHLSTDPHGMANALRDIYDSRSRHVSR